MKEYTFICPHCGKAVEVDENGYAAIIKQIRDDAFQADLEEQKRVMETEREKAVELAKTQAAIADPFSGSALAAQLYGILCLLKFEANVVIHRVQLLNRFCNPLFDITLCHIFSPSFVLVCVHIQNVFKFVARFLRITLFGNKMFCALQNPLFLIIFCIFFLLSSP